jgi:hypothetical protein
LNDYIEEHVEENSCADGLPVGNNGISVCSAHIANLKFNFTYFVADSFTGSYNFIKMLRIIENECKRGITIAKSLMNSKFS